MIYFEFKLNGREISYLTSESVKYEAYSGLGNHKNKPGSICLPDIGPIPNGRYFIVDRESGGNLGWLRDYLSGKNEWFALYAYDKKMDDYTFCQEVKRGHFRLHPEGPLGVSKGCITLKRQVEFNQLREKLLATTTTVIPNSTIKTYGTVDVI